MEAGSDVSIGLADNVLDRMDETEPMISFTVDGHFAGLHEDHELDFIEISIKLVFDLVVIKVDFSLVDIAVDLSLVDYSFICLRDNGNQII